MKIQCEFCDSMFNDTLEQCPNCGAPNSNVRRSTSDQPTTIEGLKEWYESKGLPDPEITRFFIGVDYKNPKAFGIYKEENSGNFIVYKNKADGSRAVRYKGTDEAFAVNELLTRLKQEILQQKSHNISRRASNYDSGRQNTYSKPMPKKKNKMIGAFLIAAVIFSFAAGFYGLTTQDNFRPESGYYKYDGKYYYNYNNNDYRWAVYDKSVSEWKEAGYSTGGIFGDNKTVEESYLSFDYKSSYKCTDFGETLLYSDWVNDYQVTPGYYQYDDVIYYHMTYGMDDNWYYYDDDEWISSDYVPDDLKHQIYAEDFWYTPDWSNETQITDFEDTQYYSDYQEELQSYKETYDDDDDDSYYDSDDDYDYDWGSDDSWDSDWGSDWDSDW